MKSSKLFSQENIYRIHKRAAKLTHIKIVLSINYYNKIRKVTISRSDEVNTGRFPSRPTIHFPSNFILWLSPAVGTKSTRRYKNKKFREMFLLIFLYFSFFNLRSEGYVSRKTRISKKSFFCSFFIFLLQTTIRRPRVAIY